MADAYTHYSHVCYNTEFRRSRSNRFGIGRGPKIFWDAEVPLVRALPCREIHSGKIFTKIR